MKYSIFIVVLIFSVNLSANIINIPADQPTIQAGLNIAAEGDTVLVAAGIYYENLNWPSTTGIKLIGSGVNECIIDGDSLASVIRMDYIIGTTTVIDGFTIQNGNANGDNYYAKGGGIFCLDVSLQLSSLIIIGNSASEEGGGIFCHGSNLSLYDIFVINNVSSIVEWNTGGGGIHSRYSTLDMENVNFDNNIAAGSGGGLNSISTTLDMLNIEFTNNHSLYEASGNNQFGGGGMYCYGGSSYIENVTFSNNNARSNGGGTGFNISETVMKNVNVTNNTALLNGGGIYLNQSDSEIINLLVTNNSSLLKGGAIYLSYSVSELTNSLVTNNTSGSSGGGLSINASIYPLLTNVNIINNTSSQGGGICTMLGGPRLINCILWNNEPEEIYGVDHANGSPVIAITYSDIQGGEAGIIFENGTVYWLLGNISEDPLFLGIGEHPYSLQFDSPCIDTGTLNLPVGFELPEYDIVGNTRIYGTMIDMGAYEWQGTVFSDELEVLSYKLRNYPNPFNPTTTIFFSIPEASEIELTVYNIKGQKVKQLVGDQFSAGNHSVVWVGDDELNEPVSSGIYLYKMNVDGKAEAVKRCLILK